MTLGSNKMAARAHGSLFFALFLIPFFRPAAINSAPTLSLFKPLFAAWLLLAAFFSVLFFIRRNGRIDAVLAAFLSFVLASGISTILNGGSLYLWLTQYAMLLSPFFVLTTLSEVERLGFLRALFWILTVSILIHIFSFFIFPDGMFLSADGNASWFLGNRNGVGKTCYLAVLTASLLDFNDAGRGAVRTIPLFVLSAFTMLYSNCGTGTFAIFVYGFLLYFGKYRSVRTALGMPSIITASAAWFICIVLLKLTNYLPYEQIATLLGKDLTYSSDATFTGRTYLWDYVIEKTMRAPLLGRGVQEITSFDMTTGRFYDSAHNTWLQAFSIGGFIGAAFMVASFAVAFSKISKLPDRRLSWLFVCAAAPFLIGSMFENMITFPLATYLALASSFGSKES